MLDPYGELRRIRVTLVIMAIIILFTSGNHQVEVDHISDQGYQNFNYANMVPLGDGYFAVLSSDTDDSQKLVSVYFYDKKQNKLVYRNEELLQNLNPATMQ
jgi:hypothetical protein